MPKPKTTDRKLWDRVRIDNSSDDACWEWQGSVLRGGYGSVGIIDGKAWSAHRLSWVLAFGEIPEGMCVCHRCDNPGCVRPSHLFLGTYRDNNSDKEAKGRANHPRGRQHGWQRKPESRPRGERNGRAVLTAVDVREIRRRVASGETLKAVARSYRVSDTHVSFIVARKSWSHIE
jgi:hypothetical protein